MCRARPERSLQDDAAANFGTGHMAGSCVVNPTLLSSPLLCIGDGAVG